MSAFEEASRRILEDLEHQGHVANAYGVKTDATIFLREWHYSSREPGLSEVQGLSPRARAIFKALCADEVVIEQRPRPEYFVQLPSPVLWDPRSYVIPTVI